MLLEKLEKWRNAKKHQGQMLSEKLKRWSSGFLSGNAVGEAEEMEQCCVHVPGSTRGQVPPQLFVPVPAQLLE